MRGALDREEFSDYCILSYSGLHNISYRTLPMDTVLWTFGTLWKNLWMKNIAFPGTHPA